MEGFFSCCAFTDAIYLFTARRNQNYTNILRFLNLGDKKLNPFDITHRFTHLFWLGDLNYRIDQPSTVRQICTYF